MNRPRNRRRQMPPPPPPPPPQGAPHYYYNGSRQQGRQLSFRMMLTGMAVMTCLVVIVGILPVSAVLQWYERRVGTEVSLLVQLPLYFLWFFAVYLLIRMVILVLHRKREGFSHVYMLDGALDALDQIASGNFDVVLEPDKYHHYLELIEKINQMARNLSSMEHMRQDFVSNVSHEINSPLTSIQGFARLLRQEGLDREQRDHYLEVIETECQRLSQLSDNLLKLSMLDGEQAPVELRPFRLDKQLEHVALLLEPQWSGKGIDFQAELPRAEIVGDESLLEQLWINLLHNAVKFTPQGGAISVVLALRDAVAVCTFSDSGCGIDPQCLPHIFERFYKADLARDRRIGGNGLGLSLAKRIVQLHGGSVEVASELGKGTTFTVTLPLDSKGTQ